MQTAVGSQVTVLTESASVQTDFNSVQASFYRGRSTGIQAELPGRQQIANQTTPPSDPQIGIQTEPSVQCGIKEDMNTLTVSNRSGTAIQTDVRWKTSLLSRIKLVLGKSPRRERTWMSVDIRVTPRRLLPVPTVTLCARQKVEGKRLDPFSQDSDRASADRECPRAERTVGSRQSHCQSRLVECLWTLPSQQLATIHRGSHILRQMKISLMAQRNTRQNSMRDPPVHGQP